MVTIDGHDSNWVDQFRVAAVGGQEGIDREPITTLNLLHLDLDQVPWEQLFLDRKKVWTSIELIECESIVIGVTRVLQLPLKRLYISSSIEHNDHETTMEFGRALGVGLRESTTLQQLCVSSCTWRRAAVQQFALGIEATTSLATLNLSYTAWNQEDGSMEIFSQALSRNQTITQLYLSRCRLTDVQVSTLVEEGLVDQVEDLYLGGNHLQQNAMTSLARFLKSPDFCRLQTLGISNPLLDDEDAPRDMTDSQSYLHLLWEALPYNHTLQSLHLASNRIRDDQIVDLADGIASSSTIKKLDLKSNHITNHGAILLAQHMPPQLETLWLLGNPQLGGEGARALLETMKHHANASHNYVLQDLRVPTYNMLAPVPELQAVQKEIHYWEVLNKGGRRLLTTPSGVPLGLWPLVLARVNTLDFGRNYDNEQGRLECLHFLLRGPALMER